jgi:hypothetical protein
MASPQQAILFTGGIVPAQSLTFIGQGVTGGSFNIGTANPNCLVIVGVFFHRSSATGRTLNSVTIGGTAGTIHAVVQNNANSGIGLGIASRLVTGGGSITVSYSLNGVVTTEGVVVWTCTSLGSTTPVNTGTANGSSPAISCNTSSGGLLIGMGGSNGNNVTGTTAISGLSVDGDVRITTSGTVYGHINPTTAQTPYSDTVVGPGGNDCGVFVSWL